MKTLLYIMLLLCLSSCGFKPMLAKDSSGSKAMSEVKLVSVEGPDKQRIKRIMSESFAENRSAAVCYDLKLKVSSSIFSMGIMTDSQVTRYRVNITLDYSLADSESQKILDTSSLSLRSSYDSEGSDFANYIAERTVSDNVLKELAEDLQARLILVISELEKNGKTCN